MYKLGSGNKDVNPKKSCLQTLKLEPFIPLICINFILSTIMCVLTEKRKKIVLSLRNLALLLSQLCYSGTNCILTLHSLAEMESNYVEVSPFSVVDIPTFQTSS